MESAEPAASAPKKKKSKKASPTARSLKVMRERGYYCEVVERFNSFTKTRKDFAGIIDILCLGDGEIIGVQATSDDNVSHRVTKIAEAEHTAAVRKAGIGILIHGWRKKGARWQLREVDVS